MRHILLGLILLCGFVAPMAHGAEPTKSTAAAEKVTIDKEKLKGLIETLESETARTEFINNLKALEAAQAKDQTTEEPAAPVLSRVLGIETQTQQFLTDYSQFLERNNLNSSVVGKLALSLGAFILALGLLLVNDKTTDMLRRIAIKTRDRFSLSHNRLTWYARLFRHIGQLLVITLLVYGLTIIWSIQAFAFLTGETASSIFIGALSVFTVIMIAIGLWEIVSGAIDFALKKATDGNASRLRTLLPIVRNVLFMMFAVLFALVLMSEIGINIMPLLAGAGIVGVAVGFGAQTMVKDFLSGFTVILEDLFHVGDVVRLDQFTGVVEQITLRKVQLRDVNGTVITVPYSAITVIENLTKDFSFYVVDMNVAYDANIEQVTELMQKIDSQMRQEEMYESLILEPMEIMGVERFMDSSIIVRGRLKTKPSQQWKVGREYNRRIKEAFAEAGIEIPFPQQVVHNKQA